MSTYKGPLLEALIKKLEGEIEVAKANIEVYKMNPAGIGEHSDIVAVSYTHLRDHETSLPLV